MMLPESNEWHLKIVDSAGQCHSQLDWESIVF